MSSFKDMVAADNEAVFLNLDEFAEPRTIRYDGEEYVDIPVLQTGLRQERRKSRVSDHAQGFFIKEGVVHCKVDDLGGHQPEVGQSFQINDREGGGGFFQLYKVISSGCDMGMLRIEVEAVTE